MLQPIQSANPTTCSYHLIIKSLISIPHFSLKAT
uniref:Uncharacterized protein n=1 Tax=Anguilla anguilla TaxID=7936 RepID=A0A0E9S013_ANGAN